ncbi:PREDICTED: melanoma inhibitory activity protein 3 [Myotis davidii]|nr:PREDICTED: melanoma inhibitory activity protein 3 [Myotis davidii]
MYRAEALEDFTGPDCRFVNFKKGDHVHVYYKLAGTSPEVWAGTVGRIFGYFPKDLLQVVHKYTKEELQIPADETDFVCFDGGRDTFDNYNVEELLGFLDLHNPATRDSEKALEKTSQPVEEPPEVPEESDPEPDSVQATSEERESVFSESTKELQDRPEAPKNHPPVNSPRNHPQGEQSSLEPLEEMLRDNLNASASENNSASNSSQLSSEQKTDAYKLLKKEMTVDLKTKFGSTADVLVSDDETTRLVTSLEDDFDEELDAEYYVVGKDEEEEDEEDFDELPLLTFTDGEDLRMPVESEVEKYSTDKEQNSSEEDEGEVTQPLGIKKGDKSMLTSLEDTVFSAVTEGAEQTGMDFESSDSEGEEEGEDGLIPDSKWGKPQSAADDNDPEKAEDVVPKTNNDKNPVMDTELHIKGKGRTVEESNRDLVEGKKGLEDGKKEDRTLPGSMQSSNLNSLPATEKGKEILKSAFHNKENDLKGAAVHISKGMAREEKPGEQISEGGSVNAWKHRAAGNEMKEEKIKQEAMDGTRLLGDNEHNASRDSVEKGIDVSGNGPEQHMPAAEHPSEEFKEEQLLKTQNQPRFSSPDEIGLSAELEDEGSILGRNLSGQPGGDVAAAVNTEVKGKTRLNEEEVTGDTFSEELVHPQPGTPEAAAAGQTDSAEVPGFHPEQPEAEEEDSSAEELLEDENAVSAKQSKEKGPGMQDRQLDVNPQVSGSGIFDAINTNVDTEENKENTSNILETESKNETEGRGVGTLGKEPGGPEVETEESPPAGKKAQGPSEGSDFPDKRKYQTPESGEVLRSQDPGYLKEDHPKEHPKTSGFAEKPGGELSKAGQEDTERSMDTQSQGAAAEAREGDVPGAAHTTAEHSPHREDLPIISSFFKEQQSLQRFQQYFDVHELEAMLQEMSRKLKSAQRDSLPYNVEKVLDKVFRASESQILNVAEKMLDALVTEWRDSGMKERNILEEAAVLDDVQDLIYFVRYTHSTGEETGPLATTQPPEGGWGGPAEVIQPPLEDNFPQENIEDLKMQIPEEAGHSDQPVTSHVGVLEVPQKPNTEKDEHPGIFVTESTPDYFVDGKEQLEIRVEEPASATPVMVYLTKTLLSTLPGDVQSGPDFYGLPWKPVLITAFLGILSFVIFFWRTILAVKSHVYQVTEQQISEKLKMLKKENADLVQKLSNYEQKVKESKKHVQETKKQNMILSDEATKFKHRILYPSVPTEILIYFVFFSTWQISENKISLEKLKDVIAMNASELSEVQIALNEAKLSEEKVKSECHRVQEENAKLKKKRDQLQQEIKDLNKSHAELSEQIKSFAKSQKDMEVTLTQKDDNINALTNCITQLNRLDCESESEHQHKTGNESDELANGEVGGKRGFRQASPLSAFLSLINNQCAFRVVGARRWICVCVRVRWAEIALERERMVFGVRVSHPQVAQSLCTRSSHVFSSADQIKKLEDERSSLQAAKAGLEEENKTLKQKVEILNELYQQKEMTLQKKLSQEEFERREREQRLSAADEKAVSAAEEIKTYKWRIEELEDELQKTERSFKDQISANEKKAHENWLKARAAERAMAEEKREAANLRHKLLELTQKMAMLQEPVIVKPMPGRPSTQNPPRRGPLSQNGSFGPSPVSGGECSPPPRDPPTRPLSATLSRRDVPRSEFGSVDEPPPPLQCSEAPGSPSASDPGSGAAPMMNSSPRSASPSRVGEGKVNMAAEGPPPFPGVPLMGGPLPPPIRYGPPPQLCRPFGPRPFPPPFGPGFRPPLGLREYPPGVPPGKRDVPFDPRGFVPGHPHFRPGGSPGPREYFAPGPRLPPPSHGPPEYPSPAARDSLPPGSREEPPPASQSGSQGPSQTLKQSP